MELLLNLVWLLLAVPACWLWRRSTAIGAKRNVTALHAMLVLGCTLFVLFPVISATDDLHAMRAESEESSSSKPGIGQAGSERPSAWTIRLQTPAALLRIFESFTLTAARHDLPLCAACALPAGTSVVRAGRAPPPSSLAL
jgi:hypothetical protein